MAAVGFLFLIGRNTIESLIECIKIFAGNDLNTDDVIIFDGRPARVVRVGLWKTILFIYEVGCADGKAYIKSGNKLAVQNDKLKEYDRTDKHILVVIARRMNERYIKSFRK